MNEPASSPSTGKGYKLSSALAAFVLWGGWAYYVNRHAVHGGLVSGLVQGTASFLITLGMIRLIGWFAARIERKQGRQMAAIIFPAVLTVMITGSFLVLVHSLAGTKHILFTIAPALSVAMAFALYTSYKIASSSNDR